MNSLYRRIAFALLLALALSPASATARARRTVTVIVSIDGFRPDYMHKGNTPNLDRIVPAGVAGTMRPAFPAVTFPQHWTLVTGLRPDRHGVVNGVMRDPAHPGDVFGKASDEPWWWEGGVPVWEAAERAGIRTGTVFWPGSYSALRGVRPANWVPFSKNITLRQEADFALDWLRRPAATRPRFLAIYFGDVDIAGHHYGPSSPEVARAVRTADAAIGHLRAGLRALHQPANVVVVSDHGMAEVDQSRVIQLKDWVDPSLWTPISGGSSLMIDAVPGREAELEAALAKLPAWAHCWPKSRIPAKYRYGANPRVPGYLCLYPVGARIMVTPMTWIDKGDHGYDNDAPEMRALFLATGPSFARGRRLPVFDNVDIEPLLRDLIGLPPGKDRDGDDRPFRAVLRGPASRR